MADSISKDMTPKELKEYIEGMPDGTIVSINIKVVLSNG